MTSRCQIARPGARTTNTTTLQVTEAASALDYAGPCQIQRAASSRSVSPGGAGQIQRDEYTVHLPMSAPMPAPGSVLTLTSCPDPEMVGRAFTVAQAAGQDDQAARRLTVVAATGHVPSVGA